MNAKRTRLGRVGVWHAALGRISAYSAREAVAEIEELGFGTLWFGEGSATKEALTNAAILLCASRKITVGTGIANIWARDATAMASGSATLAEAFPGRFVLGIGVSHAPLVQARGHDYRRPVAAMTVYLKAMDQAGYDAPTPTHPAPRLLAALRPRMLELARDRADGAHPYFVPVEHTERARGLLGAGRILAPEQAVVLERDPDTARAHAREHMEPYLALPNYANNLRTLGFDDGDLAGGGSDRLVDAIVAWGDVDAIRDRVKAHLEAGADHVAIQPLAPGGRLPLDHLRELAPALLSL
ncbi:LLM class F420-dependent oxidoreductase [Microtetraspora sp. NBRC 16547]|uniref:LLM class F420-dependent oxidoreductase n=1 Tax=Microtetraspora sp. NBRC 16547 TaxID=3030993 RepID=UPI0024A583DF|nr:LLM class F420-dependent oxidoreductase [Microtetraspora sp. NBRC 16547]GLW99865.1 LLM class F420-dependent oxidoreductase [Microtetraspora sp. NBRC 16547]